MGNKGGSRHFKRITASNKISIAKKTNIWLTKPMPGKHKASESISLNVLLRDYLNLADNSREVKYILNKGKVLVDGKVEKEPKTAVGLMDIISIPEIGKSYVLTIKKGKLTLEETKNEEKLCKIVKKQTEKKGKMKIVAHDGRNFIVEEKDYKIGDTIKIKVPEQKIISHFPLKAGAKCLVVKGKHAGDVANLVEILPSTSRRASGARLKSNGHEFITLKDYLFVLGE